MSFLEYVGILKFEKKPIYYRNNSGVSILYYDFWLYRLPLLGILRVIGRPDFDTPFKLQANNRIMKLLTEKHGVKSFRTLYKFQNTPETPLDISDDKLVVSIDQVAGTSEIYTSRMDDPQSKNLIWSSREVIPEPEKAPVHKHRSKGEPPANLPHPNKFHPRRGYTFPNSKKWDILSEPVKEKNSSERLRWLNKLVDKGIIGQLKFGKKEIVWDCNMHYGKARAGKALDKIYHELLLAGLRDKVEYHRHGEGKSTKIVWIGE